MNFYLNHITVIFKYIVIRVIDRLVSTANNIIL